MQFMPEPRCRETRQQEGRMRDICRKGMSHTGQHWDPDTQAYWTTRVKATK